MGYDYGYDMLGTTGSASSFVGAGIWLIIALVLSLAGCFVVYFLFVKKDDKINNKFLVWLRDFLRFDKMLIETILKITYIFVALFLTLGSFALIGTSFLAFLGMLIFGNIIARVIYEAALVRLMIWKNTTEIKKELKK
jgi:hypothetical protein